MGRRSSSDVKNHSRKAVEVAGTRTRGGRSNSDHYWTERKGKHDGPWRPGKTAKKGRR